MFLAPKHSFAITFPGEGEKSFYLGNDQEMHIPRVYTLVGSNSIYPGIIRFQGTIGVGTPRAVTFASPRIMKGTDTSALRSSTSRSIRILTFKFRRVVDTDPERPATENLPQKMKQEICLYTRTVHFLRLSFGPRYSQY